MPRWGSSVTLDRVWISQATTIGLVVVALTACGGVAGGSGVSPGTARPSIRGGGSPVPTPASQVPSTAPAPSVPPGVPVPTMAPSRPTLGGIHYIVPPGWEQTFPAPAEVRFTSDPSLVIDLRLLDPQPPPVTAANGRAVVVDGSTAYVTAGTQPPGYAEHADVSHGGHLYDVVCTGPDAQTVTDVCDGFLGGMRWTS